MRVKHIHHAVRALPHERRIFVPRRRDPVGQPPRLRVVLEIILQLRQQVNVHDRQVVVILYVNHLFHA